MDRSQMSRGGNGGGSVKRARERAAAGLPPQVPQPQVPRPNYGDDNSRAYQLGQQSARPRQPMPAALASRGDGQSAGVAISRPQQVAQWPLAAPPVETAYDQRNNQQQNNYQPPSGRGQAPQRPPRPSNVPSMLDASKLQDHTPSFQYRAPPTEQPASQLQVEDDMISPEMRSPMTEASRPSTISSVGTIPDFPLPLPQQANGSGPRRSANLGPPPSSRRGASSYYSNISYVSPIPEESPRTNASHQSYASSAAMPSRWEDERVTDDYDDERYSDDDLSRDSPPTSPPAQNEETSNLVRSASLGRKSKPTMVTMGKVPEKPEPTRAPPQQGNKLAKMGVFGPAAAATAGSATTRPTPQTIQSEQRNTVWPMIGNKDTPLASGTSFIDSSSSSESVPKIAQAVTTKDASAVHTLASAAMDPRVNQILAATAAASGSRSETPPNLDRSFSRLSAIRRPPRLDIDAVRDAEARGSLTSLPDLIRRATRLAAMMERGKRPASRNALNDFSDEDLAREKEMGSEYSRGISTDMSNFSGSGEKHHSGLSGMLAAFPPPGLIGTPTRGSPRPTSNWPSPLRSDSVDNLQGNNNNETRRKRRCCGMPVWVFLLILTFTLIVIAAAVVVPLELFVIHKKTAKPTTISLAACQANTTCANGGTTILAGNLCSCICSNGFTGPTCTSGGDTGCANMNIKSTTDASTTYNNVTLGNAIPRLVAAAQSNFSIPLVAETVMAKFNKEGISCNAENALVSFDGSDGAPTATSGNSKRDGTAGPIATDTRSAPATSSTAATSNNANFTVTEEVLDFSRVVVLYLLQVKELETAVTAQTSIQKFLDSAETGSMESASAGNVTAGTGIVVDFLTLGVSVDSAKVGGSANTLVVKREEPCLVPSLLRN